jgi:hypothetical protein
MNMNIKLFFGLAIFCLFMLAACEKTASTQDPAIDYIKIKTQCIGFSGSWLEESKECVGISEKDCSSIGGKFNECASACRNNPKADVCTMQCVIVCELK